MIKDKEKLAQMGEKAMSVAQENVEEKYTKKSKCQLMSKTVKLVVRKFLPFASSDIW